MLITNTYNFIPLKKLNTFTLYAHTTSCYMNLIFIIWRLIMVLNEKEKAAVTELQTQEQRCVEKYERYAKEAKDPVLKNLFETIHKEEQKHYDSLTKLLNGQVLDCDCNDVKGQDYNPKATYDSMSNPEDKKADNFLVTDCIGTEKLVSSEYNTGVFKFADACIRKLLADIQIEEQNHARMLYQYKTVNGMA